MVLEEADFAVDCGVGEVLFDFLVLSLDAWVHVVAIVLLSDVREGWLGCTAIAYRCLGLCWKVDVLEAEAVLLHQRVDPVELHIETELPLELAYVLDFRMVLNDCRWRALADVLRL